MGDPHRPPSLYIAGQINGYAFNIVGALPNNKFGFGAGTSAVDLSTVASGLVDVPIGGGAFGSSDGDSGDWRFGFCNTICVPDPCDPSKKICHHYCI